MDHFWGYGKPWQKNHPNRHYLLRLSPNAAEQTACRRELAELLRSVSKPGARGGSGPKRIVGPLPSPSTMSDFGVAGRAQLKDRGDCARSGPECKPNWQTFSI